MITPAFRIVWSPTSNVPGILCLICNRISWHLHDVATRYCGACHLFLEELPEDFPQHHTLDGRIPRDHAMIVFCPSSVGPHYCAEPLPMMHVREGDRYRCSRCRQWYVIMRHGAYVYPLPMVEDVPAQEATEEASQEEATP